VAKTSAIKQRYDLPESAPEDRRFNRLRRLRATAVATANGFGLFQSGAQPQNHPGFPSRQPPLTAGHGSLDNRSSLFNEFQAKP
jgi:hypothetical protein